MDLKHYLLIVFAAAYSSAASIQQNTNDLSNTNNVQEQNDWMALGPLAKAAAFLKREKRDLHQKTLIDEGKKTPFKTVGDAEKKLRSSEESFNIGRVSVEKEPAKDHVISMEVESLSSDASVKVYEAKAYNPAEEQEDTEAEAQEANARGNETSAMSSLWGKVVNVGKFLYNTIFF